MRSVRKREQEQINPEENAIVAIIGNVIRTRFDAQNNNRGVLYSNAQ